MNKAKKIAFGLSIAGAVGLTYILVSFKNMPDVFEWDDTDE